VTFVVREGVLKKKKKLRMIRSKNGEQPEPWITKGPRQSGQLERVISRVDEGNRYWRPCQKISK